MLFASPGVMEHHSLLVCATMLLALATPQHIAARVCNETELHLLAIVPSPEPPALTNGSEFEHGRDRGWELLPAAQLAAETINSRSDILDGYRIKIIPAVSDPCNVTFVSDALISFVRFAINSEAHNVVGVIGLTCSSVTATIAEVASLPTVQTLLISSGVNSAMLNKSGLFQVFSSTAARNDALLELMAEMNWNSIGLIRDSIFPLYSETGQEFARKVTASNFTLAFNTELSTGVNTINQALNSLQQTGSRINYASVTDSQARVLLCEAAKRGLSFPNFQNGSGSGYIWVMHDHPLDEFKSPRITDQCTGEDMVAALEGGFIILSRLYSESNTNQPLVSNQTFDEYTQEYISRLGGIPPDEETQGHASAMHDSVWAFALGLNASLSMLSLPEDLRHCGLSDSTHLTDTVSSVLQNATFSFSGALGQVSFGMEREARTVIEIFQVQGGEQVLVAEYDPKSGLHIVAPVVSISDSFDRRIARTPLPLTITVIILIAMLIFATTLVLISFVYYWQSPDIKAATPALSMILLTGCYGCLLSAVFSSVQQLVSGVAFEAMCNLETWFAIIGIVLIFSPLFLRLLRVYRIFYFHHWGKLGGFWTDQSLLLFSILMLLPALVVLIVWMIVEPCRLDENMQFIFSTRPPFYEVTQRCLCSYLTVWYSLLVIYFVIIIAPVVVLAVLTRKVKLESFKDTKKVTIYVFSTIIVLGTLLPLAVILDHTRTVIVPYILQTLSVMIVPLLCLLLLFVPKLWSTAFPETRSKNSSSSSVNDNNANPVVGITRRVSKLVLPIAHPRRLTFFQKASTSSLPKVSQSVTHSQ